MVLVNWKRKTENASEVLMNKAKEQVVHWVNDNKPSRIEVRKTEKLGPLDPCLFNNLLTTISSCLSILLGRTVTISIGPLLPRYWIEIIIAISP